MLREIEGILEVEHNQHTVPALLFCHLFLSGTPLVASTVPLLFRKPNWDSLVLLQITPAWRSSYWHLFSFLSECSYFRASFLLIFRHWPLLPEVAAVLMPGVHLSSAFLIGLLLTISPLVSTRHCILGDLDRPAYRVWRCVFIEVYGGKQFG